MDNIGWVETLIGVAFVVLTIFGGALASVKGYFTSSPRNGHTSRPGAVWFDITIGERIAEHLKRLADTIERIERQMKATADAEDEARKIAAAVAAERAKWERERLEGDRNG